MHVLLKKFPIPDTNISWELINEIKQSKDMEFYRNGLGNWINRMGDLIYILRKLNKSLII